MHAQLIPLDGGPAVTLARDVVVVGRKPGVCDLVIERGSVSKMHCLIVKTDGLLFIRDLGSTNGTKVNGQKVIRGALLPGDELSFAGAKFRVHLGPDRGEISPNEATEMLTSYSNENGAEEGEGESLPDQPPPFALNESDSDVRLLGD